MKPDVRVLLFAEYFLPEAAVQFRRSHSPVRKWEMGVRDMWGELHRIQGVGFGISAR
jgi:hypothetical protein